MSAGWASVTSMVTVWFEQEKWGAVFGILSTSSRFGAVCASLGLGALMRFVGWRGVFWTASGVCSIVITWCLFMLVAKPKFLHLKLDQPKHHHKAINVDESQKLIHDNDTKKEEEEDDNVHPMEKLSGLQALLVIVTSSRFWLLCLSQMCFTIIFELNSFLPMFLKDTKKLAPSDASSSSSLFGIGALSVLVFGVIYDKVNVYKFGRLILMVLLSTVGTACSVTIWLFPDMPLSVTVALIFVLGFCCSPGFYLPQGMV